MARTSDVSEALATLQARWGSAAPRRGGDLLLHPVEGALARVAVPVEEPDDAPDGAPTPLVSTPRHRPAEPAPDLDGHRLARGAERRRVATSSRMAVGAGARGPRIGANRRL